jgi:hypothetical protein
VPSQSPGASARALESVPVSLKIIFALICGSQVIGLPIDLIRLGWPETEWIAVVMQSPKAIVTLVIALGGYYGLGKAVRGTLILDGFCQLLVVMIVLATSVGLVAVSSGAYPLKFFVPHLGSGLLMLVGYAAFLNCSGEDTSWFESMLLWTAKWTLVGMAVILPIFLVRRMGSDIGLYWGFNSQSLIVSVCVFAAFRMPVPATLSALLILVNGKRGVVLALIAVVGLMLWRTLKRPNLVEQLKGAGLGLVGVAIVIGFLGLVRMSDADLLPVGISDTVAKWQLLLIPQDYGVDLDLGSGGRTSEIEESFAAFIEHPTAAVVGTGYGWSFAYSKYQERQYAEPRLHYVHLSPLNIIYIYGAFLGGLWCLAVVANYLRLAGAVIGGTVDGRLAFMVALIVTGDLVGGLTGYSYGTDPRLWCLLGLLARLESNPTGSLVGSPSRIVVRGSALRQTA